MISSMPTVIQVTDQRPYLLLLRHEQQEQQMQQRRKELAFMRKKLCVPTDPLKFKVETIHCWWWLRKPEIKLIMELKCSQNSSFN